MARPLLWRQLIGWLRPRGCRALPLLLGAVCLSSFLFFQLLIYGGEQHGRVAQLQPRASRSLSALNDTGFDSNKEMLDSIGLGDPAEQAPRRELRPRPAEMLPPDQRDVHDVKPPMVGRAGLLQPKVEQERVVDLQEKRPLVKSAERVGVQEGEIEHKPLRQREQPVYPPERVEALVAKLAALEQQQEKEGLLQLNDLDKQGAYERRKRLVVLQLDAESRRQAANAKRVDRLRDDNDGKLLGSEKNAYAGGVAEERLEPHRKPIYRLKKTRKRKRRTETPTTTTSSTTTLDRTDPYIAVEFPIYRAATASTGQPWPYPASFMSNESTVFRVKDNLVFKSVAHNCNLLDDAINRYRRSVAALSRAATNMSRIDTVTNLTLDSLEINVKHSCSGAWPSLEMNEWYALMVTSRVAVLYANEIWGALRGLETFRQMLYINNGEVHINFSMTEDQPRFRHRGILLDTARHYLSVDVLKQNLEAMAQNKFNVFHWHIVDDQSFPYKSERFPELWQKGAYHPSMVYSKKVIQDVINYARRRGIRVVPEFDTPGHTRSWGLSHPELLSDCQHDFMLGPLDPTKNNTYRFLHDLFSEVTEVFADDYLHLGGDEASFVCWQRNVAIRKFLKQLNRADDFHYLEKYYFDRLLRILQALPRKPKAIVWQEVFDNGIRLNKDSVIAVWKGNEMEMLGSITTAGYRAISTSCWYLNYIKYSTSWHRYYLCDPHNFNADNYPDGEELKKRVIGGEACMWGEFVDDTNLMTTLWPRAIAVAERLWSPQTMRDPRGAEPRFEEQNCRMRSRGIITSPEDGPSSCLHSANYDKIWIRSFIPEHPEYDMQ